MGNRVHHFNLPPILTCTSSEWCSKYCYALKNNFTLPNVINSWNIRFEMSKQENFVNEMINYIRKHNVEYFRIHGSGDFYSSEYVENWINIVKECPDTKFKVHTKRVDLEKELISLSELPNIIIRESIDPSKPTPKMKFPLSSITGFEIEPSYFCPNKCEPCGYYCWNNKGNIHCGEH